MGHRVETEEELAALGLLVLPTERGGWYAFVRPKRFAVEDPIDVDRARPLLARLRDGAAEELADAIRRHCAPTLAVEVPPQGALLDPDAREVHILAQAMRGHRPRLRLECVLDWRQLAWRLVPLTTTAAEAVRREALELLPSVSVRIAPHRRPALVLALAHGAPWRVECVYDWEVVRDELNRRALRL
jgi:hypothetical protein